MSSGLLRIPNLNHGDFGDHGKIGLLNYKKAKIICCYYLLALLLCNSCLTILLLIRTVHKLQQGVKI